MSGLSQGETAPSHALEDRDPGAGDRRGSLPPLQNRCSVLITGGLGYVGGRVARHLAGRPNRVLRLTSRRPPPETPSWLGHGEVVAWDTAQAAEPILDGIDTIVHFAAINEVESLRDPVRALDVNGRDTLRLLLAGQRAGVRRFVYFSTAHVYGAPLTGDIDEERLARPVHPYAISHKVAEDFVLAAARQRNIEGLVLRLSNGFGVPVTPDVDRWTLIANDLCRQAITTGKLRLRTSGLQQRDFVTLHDVARCVEHVVSLPASALQDGLFNLGGGRTLSIYALAEMVARRCDAVLGFRPPIERPEPTASETAPDLRYRIGKLKATGFAVTGDFDAEIDDTLRLCSRAFAVSG